MESTTVEKPTKDSNIGGTTRHLPRAMKIVPPMWIVIFLALGLCIHFLFDWRAIMDWRFYPAAIILFAIGLISVLWAGSIFHKKGTEILPSSPTNKLLIVEGPFKISRNPMYLGMTLIQLGIAFFVGTLPMFLVPVAFFCLINFVFIPFEEEKMLRQFGEEYSDYKRRVRRWI